MEKQLQGQQQKNIETHHATGYIANDLYWQEVADKYASFSGTAREAVRRLFAMELKSGVLQSLPPRDSFFGFQLLLSLKRIDWEEVAETLLNQAVLQRKAV